MRKNRVSRTKMIKNKVLRYKNDKKKIRFWVTIVVAIEKNKKKASLYKKKD